MIGPKIPIPYSEPVEIEVIDQFTDDGEEDAFDPSSSIKGAAVPSAPSPVVAPKASPLPSVSVSASSSPSSDQSVVVLYCGYSRSGASAP